MHKSNLNNFLRNRNEVFRHIYNGGENLPMCGETVGDSFLRAKAMPHKHRKERGYMFLQEIWDYISFFIWDVNVTVKMIAHIVKNVVEAGLF